MKSAYIINENGKLLGSTILNDNEEVLEGFVLQPLPPYDKDIEIPVWRNNAWVAELTEDGREIALQRLRQKRNELLSRTDWTQLQDVGIPVTKLTEIQTYRQQLRDITNIEDPRLVVWPEIPDLR